MVAPERLPADWPHRSHSLGVHVGPLDWHVQRMGKGPLTILLLHGSGASAHSWADVMPLLAPHATVLAPDLPGHGYTLGATLREMSLPAVAKSLQALLTTLGLPAPTLVVGHSAGVALALRWALSQATTAPHAIVGFNPSLIAPPAVYTRFLGPLITPLATSGPVASLLAGLSGRSGMVGRLLDSTGSRTPAAQRARYEALFRNPAHVSGSMGFVAAADLQALLAQVSPLSARCRWVLGAQDAWIPEPALRRVINSAMPAAQCETWQGGHLLHEVEPERAARLVLQQLTSSTNTSTASGDQA